MLLLVLFSVLVANPRELLYMMPVAPVVQLVTSKPSETLGREFDSR